MMLPTHGLIGLAIALPVAMIHPEFADVALLGGFVGGVVPDLDMYAGHRRTLHYPVYYPALSVVAAPLALTVPTTTTITAGVAVTAAAVHSVMDVFGGGIELRPWEATSDRAVFDHHRGRWIAPRRWVRYDGAPEDFLLTVAIAGPLFVAVDGGFRAVVVASVAVATVYVGVRRTLPSVAEFVVEEVLVDRFPPRVLVHLPARYGPSE